MDPREQVKTLVNTTEEGKVGSKRKLDEVSPPSNEAAATATAATGGIVKPPATTISEEAKGEKGESKEHAEKPAHVEESAAEKEAEEHEHEEGEEEEPHPKRPAHEHLKPTPDQQKKIDELKRTLMEWKVVELRDVLKFNGIKTSKGKKSTWIDQIAHYTVLGVPAKTGPDTPETRIPWVFPPEKPREPAAEIPHKKDAKKDVAEVPQAAHPASEHHKDIPLSSTEAK